MSTARPLTKVRPELLRRDRSSLRRRVAALEDKIALIEREQALLRRLSDLNGTGSMSDLKTIEGAVCEEFQVHPMALKSASRIAHLVDARHVFFHLARKLTEHSLEEIGRFNGGRDHGTVSSGDQRISVQREQPSEAILRTHLERLETRLSTLNPQPSASP